MSSSHTQRIEDLVAGSTSPRPVDLKVALSRLSLEIKDRLAKGSSGSFDFFVAAVEALSKIKGAGNAELRLACISDCGKYFYVGGYPDAAIQTAKLAIALASHVNSKPWKRKTLNFLGVVHADRGNVSEALVCYAAALSIARQIEDSEAEISVLMNSGAAFNYAGMFQEAMRCFAKSAERANEKPELAKYVATALSNLAQSYLLMDEQELGFQAIAEALRRSAEPKNAAEALSRTIREFTFVQLALEKGLITEARRHVELCEKYGRWGGTLRSQVLADIARGLCEVHSGKVDTGLVLLANCLVRSNEVNSARSDALIALVKAFDLVGRPEDALAYLREFLGHIRMTRNESISTLLSLPNELPKTGRGDIGERELRALEFKESQLRAKVAERELFVSRIEMLERLAVTADLREDASGEHGYRVGKLAALLAEDLGWDREKCHAIELAARLHDIGKIAVPDRILLTSEALKEAERHFMCNHTAIGAELLAKSKIPQLRMAEEIARSHHEWWNGRGYPARLSGKRIPLHARIVAIADVFDALTHGRPYEQAWPMDRALEQVRGLRGLQFDPDLTDRFLDLVDRLRAEHADLDEFLGRAGRNSPFLQAREKIRQLLSEERGRHATVPGNQTRH